MQCYARDEAGRKAVYVERAFHEGLFSLSIHTNVKNSIITEKVRKFDFSMEI